MDQSQRSDEDLIAATSTPPDLDATLLTPFGNLDLPAGTRLGRYAIIEVLGAGGMGMVYRARDERLERIVALKLITPSILAGDQARRRFHKEALTLARLSHTHIAAVYDVGQQDAIDFIVMEYIPGESLQAKLAQGPLPVKDATSIVLQIAEALREAHEAGVIHRDLKPANVMITPKGQVKVLDFGIAKLLQREADTEAVAPTLLDSGVVGTPHYMSPEQVSEKPVDARSDLWSLGVVYYELLTGQTPFRAESIVSSLRAIMEREPKPIRQLRLDVPPLAEKILARSLQKDPGKRYQTAGEFASDASDLLASLTSSFKPQPVPTKRTPRLLAAALMVLICTGAGLWLYRSSRRHWVKEEAILQAESLFVARKPLAASLLLEEARKYLPNDPQIQQLTRENIDSVSITSSPAGATVEIKDYSTPAATWHRLGITPLTNISIPKGYFRWRLTRRGAPEVLSAPSTSVTMFFALDADAKAPAGMTFAAAQTWSDYVSFIGWVGPYKLPPYFVDRFEVTNRYYQNFVDGGGYQKPQYWPAEFDDNGRKLSWQEAMQHFRDTSGRPGPATWEAGHFPAGKADFPVAGVSWYEASAYASFAGKSLPVLAQWVNIAPPDAASYTIAASNIFTGALAKVGAYNGIGPYGTYDMAGNVREWVGNTVDGNLRFILGGSWQSPTYLYTSPEALSPFDRAETNGFRCVQNLAPIPQAAAAPIQRVIRDFSLYKPVSDEVFNARKILFDYAQTPLNVTLDGTVRDTLDWREEKVSFDAAYGGERLSAYLFLPKNVHPPYQTVLFFPSARVDFIPDNNSGRELGDIQFFDYILQSGRAVMYPIYQDTYERRARHNFPGASQSLELTSEWYKDAARSLDYLSTRPDIDSSRFAYLGVSMGSADGVIITTLLQDRLKTAVFLDGGYFLDPPPPGGDQADFVTRLKKPVLMVNGRYDFTFPLDKAQNPFFSMLATPPQDKRHVVLETPHDVTEQRPQLVKEVLEWLDHYLGRVNE